MSSLTGQPPAAHLPLSLRGAPPPILSIAAYGYMAELARQAMVWLAYEKEIFIELVVPTQPRPPAGGNHPGLGAKTGRLLVLEEGSLACGWGAEVVARLVESGDLRASKIRRLAALDLPVPASGPPRICRAAGNGSAGCRHRKYALNERTDRHRESMV